MTEKQALEILSFWAGCFDYKNFSSKKPLHNGQSGCEEAEWVLEDFIENNKLTASEAIFGFCGWLTMRSEQTVMSGVDDAAPVVDLIKRFCDENKLAEPREDYTKNLSYPEVIKVLT